MNLKANKNPTFWWKWSPEALYIAHQSWLKLRCYYGNMTLYMNIFYFNPLSAKKSKVKVTLCLPASPPLFTFQFHPLVVSLSENAGTCFYVKYTPHPALKGLRCFY